MHCNPMKIPLQEIAKPIFVTTDRRVPEHYEPESKITVDELVERQIITLVNELTWCCPASSYRKQTGNE